MKFSKIYFLFFALILMVSCDDGAPYSPIPKPDTENNGSGDPAPNPSDDDNIPNLGSRPCAYKNGAPLFEIKLTSERPRENRVYVSGVKSEGEPTIHMSCWKDGDKELWIMSKGLAPAIKDTGDKGKWIRIDKVEKIMGGYVQLKSGDLRFITLFIQNS